jgi:hypothetical protein
MPDPVVHFEIIGADPERLRTYYRDLFGWEYNTSGEVSDAVSEPTNYGFIEPIESAAGGGIAGGVGGGPAYAPGHVFYVSVPDVEVALQRAESLGGTRLLGPAAAPSGLVVGQFMDPEGNRIGLAALPSADAG